MKRTWFLTSQRTRWLFISPLAAALASLSVASAAEGDTNAPPQAAAAPEQAEPAAEATEAAEEPAALTPEQSFEGGAEAYVNWIELGVGGSFIEGNKAQFQQHRRTSGDAFGGIQDFHYQRDLAKGTTFKADARALFDENDYRVRLEVAREKLGYIRFAYDEARSWYNAHGGYFPPADAFYQFSGNAEELDRGEISFEAGLRLEKVPQITFRYARKFREGAKNSTRWGLSHPASDDRVRGISPTVNEIDEYTDSFSLDARHRIKATALGVGLRYETGEIDNSLLIRQWPGEIVERRITDQEKTRFDLFNVHAFTETWFKNNKYLFSSGFSYTDLDNDFSGSRIFGEDFDVGYAPNALNGAGYYGLGGGSRLHEYVMNLNFLARLGKNLTLVPSIRVQREDTDANASGMQTSGTAAPVPFSADSERGVLDVRERLDLNYTGLTNWVFHARAEWTQGDGNLEENGGLGPINNVGIAPIQRETDDSRFFQKYSAGARWYPARSVVVDAGGYLKDNEYEYDHEEDSTLNSGPNRYPAYLETQQFRTYDANVRLTLRPRRNVNLVSRYEHQWSTIDTRPDSESGLGAVESSEMTTHILAQDVHWSPFTRLYFQAGVNYVLSETETPASDVTRAILDADNNYWTVHFATGLTLDDKTDLRIGYSYYEADNYDDNSASGLPLEAGALEHGVTATVTRRLNKNLRLLVRYGYYSHQDRLFGRETDFDAHTVYSSLQYRF